MKPDESAEDRTETIKETAASVLEGKRPSETFPSCATLETYNKTPIFIPVGIMEEAVEIVAQKRLEISGPGGTDSGALQGWLMKFG